MLSTYYLFPAVERAMKIQEVILRAIEGRLKWYQDSRDPTLIAVWLKLESILIRSRS